ncbi:MAG: hypothetical protein AAGC68_13225, partial [Verrucomicrobiota bacterium]
REHRDSGAIEEVRHRFPNGWIAVDIAQICASNEDRLKEALRRVAEEHDLGLVLFDSTCGDPSHHCELSKWAHEFPEWSSSVFSSGNIWDIASLLYHSRLYCGASLDCRILAMGAGIARINVPVDSNDVFSYTELWEDDSVPIEFANEEDWVDAIGQALETDLSQLQEHAKKLHRCYFESLELYCEALGFSPKLSTDPDLTRHEEVSAQYHHLDDGWLNDAPHEPIRQRPSNPSRLRLSRRLPA